MSINLTAAAADRIRSFMSREGLDESSAYFRLGVEKTGCSGWGYVVGLEREPAANDQMFKSQDIAIVVDAEQLELLKDTEIDYKREGINSVFAFKNPNMAAECGCGESFTV